MPARRLLPMICLLIPLAGCQRPDATTESMVGAAAPNFSLTTLDGRPAVLADQRGKVVVMEFSATWCDGCQLSLPHTQKLSADNARSARGLTVWVIDSSDDAATISGYLDANHFNMTVVMDPQGVAALAYHLEPIPTTVVIGRNGMIQNVFTGYYSAMPAELDAAVDQALSK